MKATKILLFLSISFFLLLPLAVGAQGLCEDVEGNSIPCMVDLSTAPESTNIGGYIRTIYNSAVGLGILAALIMITAGGVMYVVSGVINKKQLGKDFIAGALGGLTLLLGAYVILKIVNPELVTLDNPQRVDVLTLRDSFAVRELTQAQRNLIQRPYECSNTALNPYQGLELKVFTSSEPDVLEAMDIAKRLGASQTTINYLRDKMKICIRGEKAAHLKFGVPYYPLYNSEIIEAASSYNPPADATVQQRVTEETRVINEINGIRGNNIKRLQGESILSCPPMTDDLHGGVRIPWRTIFTETAILYPEIVPVGYDICPKYKNPHEALGIYTAEDQLEACGTALPGDPSWVSGYVARCVSNGCEAILAYQSAPFEELSPLRSGEYSYVPVEVLDHLRAGGYTCDSSTLARCPTADIERSMCVGMNVGVPCVIKCSR